MMVRVGIGIVVGLATAAGLSAELEGLDEILSAHYEALGGVDRLQSVESARFLGVMSIGVEAEAPFVMTFKRPLKSRLEFTVEGLTGIQAFDGKTAWMILPMMGQGEAREMPEGQALAMAEQADFDGPLVDWKSKGHQLALLGIEELESGQAYKIEVTLANGKVRNYFLDTATFLTVRQEGNVSIQGNEVEVETRLSNYKEAGGLMFPHLIESRAKGAPAGQRFAFDQIELDVDVSDDLFVMPTSATASASPPGQ